MDIDEILLETEDTMQKSLDYCKNELKGIRTGRATTGLVEYVKVDYYGSPTDLRQLAMINVPEPSQILIKPFDASSLGEIRKAIEASGLGLTPNVEDKVIRLNIPPLTGERRKQLVASVKHMGEQAKVAMRNARRDANKHLDQIAKDKSAGVSEDEIDTAKHEVQDLLKKYEGQVEEAVNHKAKEIEAV